MRTFKAIWVNPLRLRGWYFLQVVTDCVARVWFDKGQVLVARHLLLLVLDVTRRVRLCVELVLVYFRLIDMVVHARSR